jgi:hypothetical protein
MAIEIENRAQRIEQSALKIEPPFRLDPTLCLYSPQDNVDSLNHERIKDWFAFTQERYVPDLPDGTRKVLLFMPCTKTKPYPFSSEHQAINQRLLDEGFKPTGRHYLPQQLQARLEPGFSPEVLNLSPLINDSGTVIHRMVISEPMAVVPYEHIVTYEGKESPSAQYDDPGLFENRANAVSPWRADSTAVQIGPTRWKWGANEVAAYVAMHNAMAQGIAKVLERIGPHYTDIISWVSPGLTHRSFVIAAGQRRQHQVVASRQVGTTRQRLVGANDLLPEGSRIDCLPMPEDCQDAVERLVKRLGTNRQHAMGIYSRGGANATPLALPELLDVLMRRVAQ